MKSNLIIASLLLLLTSCGNPHISSSRSGVEKTHPPLSTRQNEHDGCTPPVYGKYEFFVEESGEYPIEFMHVLKCKKLISENFQNFPVGQTFLVTNRGTEQHNFELVHMLERNSTVTKNTYLEDIFGEDNFPMMIESPVQNEGITGENTGVNSMDADSSVKDSLVWSFSTPVKSWGIKTVNLDSLQSAPAKLRLFDCQKSLIQELNVVLPERTNSQFIGFMAGHPPVCHVSLTTGKLTGSLVIDEMIYSE